MVGFVLCSTFFAAPTSIHHQPITTTPRSIGFVCVAKETEEACEGEGRNESPPTIEGLSAKYTTTHHGGMCSLSHINKRLRVDIQ